MRKLVIAALCGRLCAFGWGGEGHILIARIAYDQLTPAVRQRIAEILGPDKTLPSISSWADEVRRSRPDTANWHFIDIPINKPHLDMDRDCPKGDCVLAKIEDFRKALKDPAIPADQRREDLMFLVHFVGDMHQPLHCSDNQDRGGNSVRVQFFDRTLNLHSLWDSALLNRMPKEEELYAQYSADSAKHAKKWSKGTVYDWAEEAHKLSVKTTYGRLPKAPAGTVLTIDARYEQKADPVVRLQIEKAGARLARVLNEALQ